MYDLFDRIHFSLHHRHHCFPNDIQYLYLGKDFIRGRHGYRYDKIFSTVPVTVSPQHKDLTSINGILVFKKDLSPALDCCGDGYYKLKRNDKWGIIDSQLNPITQFKYDYICRFDNKGLCEVEIDKRHGFVNKQGAEQIPVIYERISRIGRLYEVKQNGEEFTIDELGNRKDK